MPKCVAIGLKYEQLEGTAGRAARDAGSGELVLMNFPKKRSIARQREVRGSGPGVLWGTLGCQRS